MRSPDLLMQNGLFRFEHHAVLLIDEFIATMERSSVWLQDDPTTPDRVAELVALTAAEYALLPLFSELRPALPLTNPISVQSWAASVAVLKCDCACIEFCSPSFSLLDITAFSGDISKLRLVDIPVTARLTEIGDIARAVDKLEAAHRQSPAELPTRMGESGLLRLQGFLWAVKLSLPHQDLAEAVTVARDALQLDEPTTTGPAIA